MFSLNFKFSRHKYTDAIQMMRRHRVNMNLVYDHDPQAFMRNLKNLVNNGTNPELLTLFISDLMWVQFRSILHDSSEFILC